MSKVPNTPNYAEFDREAPREKKSPNPNPSQPSRCDTVFRVAYYVGLILFFVMFFWLCGFLLEYYYFLSGNSSSYVFDIVFGSSILGAILFVGTLLVMGIIFGLYHCFKLTCYSIPDSPRTFGVSLENSDEPRGSLEFSNRAKEVKTTTP
jgi:hypothetical protein